MRYIDGIGAVEVIRIVHFYTDHARGRMDERLSTEADHRPRGIELLGVSHGVDVRGLPEQAAVGRLLEEYKMRILA